MKLCPPKPAKFLQLINKYWPQPISVIPQHPLQSFQTFDCKRIIFSVYNIWWTINFPLFSMDLIWWLIKIHFLSLFKLHTRFFFIGCKTYPLEVETKSTLCWLSAIETVNLFELKWTNFYQLLVFFIY